jgi:hypothetical protein
MRPRGHGRRLSAFIAVGAVYSPCAVHGQFTDPRNYTASPVGLNQLELEYAYVHSDASIDTSLVVGGASLELNQVTIAYTHDFSLLGHLAWIKASVPFASISGSVPTANISGSTTGTGDLSFEFATLLRGGRALSMAEFATYQPTTTLGVSLTVTVPTGEYDPDKLLNLGSHRWSFKPEIGLAHPFGPEQKWEIDAYVNVYFFTDNTMYREVEILRQDPLPGLEAHISYSFTPSLWVSFDSRYSFRGDTLVDGINQQDAQENLTVGTEASWSPNAHNSLVLVFSRALVHKNAPTDTGVALKYIYSWGRGYE